MAVTAAKKVKTQVSFSRANSSVIHQAIERLEDQGFSLQGKTCMVIGNGEMGKVTALALKEAGADVTVTVRQYSRINYGERLEFLPKCDLVVSATASPNYTLTMEQIENAKIPGHVVLIDLAVPRDIEPSAGTLNNVTLYDIDSFKIDAVSPKLQASLDQAGEILREQQEEFYNWYNGRDLIPRIQEIKADAVEDLNLRIMKILRKTPMEDSDRENLLKAIDTAAFPLFVDLTEKKILVVGAGKIASRRVKTLLPFAGEITVEAPEAAEELLDLAEKGEILYRKKAYAREDLYDADMVIAATDSREVNEDIYSACKCLGIQVNVASDQNKCDFHFPGILEYDGVVMGFNGSGRDHRKVRQVREKVQEALLGDNGEV